MAQFVGILSDVALCTGREYVVRINQMALTRDLVLIRFIEVVDGVNIVACHSEQQGKKKKDQALLV